MVCGTIQGQCPNFLGQELDEISVKTGWFSSYFLVGCQVKMS